MSITSDTMQFIARLFACTLAVSVLAIIGVDIGVIFHFGDGIATQYLRELNGPLFGAISALGLGTLGHQVLAAVIARMLPSSGSTSTTPSAPVSVPVAPPDASSNVASSGAAVQEPAGI
jgi:hypothetical protein